ncbi:uncharacterized protein LOC128959401 [Oppia nitens]|uniref:uncharacterized protein LOC128959401 n=1 Tax=Oppia nitens TaxID=1686743 RepID=UPI0023DC5665|nr:uncharacterized protein LOC128959401 [Oppia nitens]
MIKQLTITLCLILFMIELAQCVYVQIKTNDIQYPKTDIITGPIRSLEFMCNCDYDTDETIRSVSLTFNGKRLATLNNPANETKISPEINIAEIFKLTKLRKQAAHLDKCEITVMLFNVSRDSLGDYRCEVNYNGNKIAKSLMYYTTTRWSNNSLYFIEYHNNNAIAYKLSFVLSLFSILTFVLFK